MKTLLLLAVTSLLSGEALPDADLTSLVAQPWIRLTDSWTQAPPEIVKEESAPAIILRFRQDGTFTMVYCLVGRVDPRSEMGILVGEGLTVFTGQWEQGEDQHLAVEYHKVSETFKPVGGKPTAEVQEALAELSGHTLYFGAERDTFTQDPLLAQEYTDSVLATVSGWKPAASDGTADP